MKVLITGGNGGIALGIAKVLAPFYEVINPSRQELNIIVFDNVVKYMNSVKPDVLVNCAGFIQPNSISETRMDDVLRDMEINYVGPFMCSKYALQNGCKTIINIGSTSGLEGRANWSAYCSSKAALVALTESMAKEGINAYGIHPARTKSKMRERLFPGEDQNTLMDPKRIGEVVLTVLWGHFNPGIQIVITKDKIIGLPMRTCPK